MIRAMLLAVVASVGLLAVLALLVLLSSALALRIAFRDLCGNEQLSEQPSPSGRFKVVTFSRSCGATTGFSTHVSVLPIGSALPNAAGNILVARIDRGGILLGSSTEPSPVLVRWEGERVLILEHHISDRIFMARHRYAGVNIDYLVHR